MSAVGVDLVGEKTTTMRRWCCEQMSKPTPDQFISSSFTAEGSKKKINK